MAPQSSDSSTKYDAACAQPETYARPPQLEQLAGKLLVALLLRQAPKLNLPQCGQEYMMLLQSRFKLPATMTVVEKVEGQI